MRLNIGSCDLPLPQSEGWVNIDNSLSPHIKADLILDARELEDYFGQNAAYEIYAGHFVEHLTTPEAEDWIAMCYRVLKPGGIFGFVTPDFRYISERYLAGDPKFNITELEETYLYSWKQESRHASIWDLERQKSILMKNKFTDVQEIDRMKDDRLAYPAEWQVGCQGIK